MRKKASVGILGGGISGLTIAYELHRQGIDVQLYEKNSMPGGVIQSVHQEDWLTEKGPNTLMVNRQPLWDLLRDLQLDDKIVKAGKISRKRFIVKDGWPVDISLSATGSLKTDLFSSSAKFRLLKEPFVPASKQDDESISAFISRRLGQEPLDYAVNPFVSGIYGGTPEALSVKHTFSKLWELEQSQGSLVKGMLRNKRSGPKAERALVSFTGGLETLPRTLYKQLGDAVQCNTEVKKLSRSSDGWAVQLETPDGSVSHEHSFIVSTLPVYTLQSLFKTEEPAGNLARLSDIPYASLSVIALGFRRDQVEHPLDGFGMLIPGAEPYRLLGTLFSSSLFPNRAPEDHVLLTSFIGGARNPELAHKSTQELMTIAVQDLSHLLQIHGTPVFSDHTYWRHAIPQYEVGYDVYLEAMQRFEDKHPGLLLAGNFRHGVSVPDCIINGIETARRAARLLLV